MLCAKLPVVVGVSVTVMTSLNHRVPVASNQITDDVNRLCVYFPFVTCLIVYPTFVMREQVEVDLC